MEGAVGEEGMYVCVPVEDMGTLALRWEGGPMIPTHRGGREWETEGSNGGDLIGTGERC